MPAQCPVLPLLSQLFTLQWPPYLYPLVLTVCVLLANSFGFSILTPRTTKANSAARKKHVGTGIVHEHLLHTRSLPHTGLASKLAMDHWEYIRREVQQFRRSLPPNYTIQDIYVDAQRKLVYFVGSDPTGDIRMSTLYYINIQTDESYATHNQQRPCIDQEAEAIPAILSDKDQALMWEQNDVMLCANSDIKTNGVSPQLCVKRWRRVLSTSWLRDHWRSVTCTEELLSKERQRLSYTNGISHVQMDQETRRMIFMYGGLIYQAHLDQVEYDGLLEPVLVSSHISSDVYLNPTLGGRKRDLIAFIRHRNLWVTTLDGLEVQLTYSGENEAIMNGVAEYVIQEEFSRFTGYEWSPLRDTEVTPTSSSSSSSSLESILYLQVDESMVDVVYLSSRDDSEVEKHRYPRVGQRNAVSTLCLVEFAKTWDGQVDVGTIRNKKLRDDCALSSIFPQLEYIVRFGWLQDAQSVWVQLLDRRQKHTMYVRIPIACFDETDTCALPEILYEEKSDFWLNITHTTIFLQVPTAANLYTTVFLITSEQNDKRQLYRIHSRAGTWTQIPLTPTSLHLTDTPITVDYTQGRVYFLAKKDTPLETYLFSTSIYGNAEHPICCLTQPGRSVHHFTVDTLQQKLIVHSSSSDAGSTWEVFNILPHKHHLYISPSQTLLSVQPNPSHPRLNYFQFPLEDGTLLHGCFYKPVNYVDGMRYPTILYVYGGPHVQLVTNDFKYPKHMRHYLATRLGFAVVMIDGRGSSERGFAFERHIYGRMGTVEIEDQLAGLRWLSNHYGIVDLNRVAIVGWSYGGYLSLMGLAQHPEAFKIAIAGAPVTSWHIYDTAYTERYMGMPDENPHGYELGSVFHYIDRFPDEPNRLLIIHGLLDENVHYKHSELLSNMLHRHRKPHHLQVYSRERHGLRSLDANEHYETLMYWWLRSYL